MVKMNFLILLALAVIFILSMGLYLLNQNEEKSFIDNQKEYQFIQKQNRNNSNLKNNAPESNQLNSNINYNSSNSDSQSTKNNPNLNDSISSTQQSNNATQNQIRNLTVDTKNERNNIINNNPTSDNQVKIQSNIKSQLLPEIDNSEKLIFTFAFLDREFQNKSKHITVPIPVRTHNGFINEYTYVAKLEKEQFSLSWETPGWFPYENYAPLGEGVRITYNSIIISNISNSEKTYSIMLKKMIPLELSFETEDNSLIPDSTSISFFEKPPFVEIYSPIILNQKCILNVEPGKVVEVKSMSISQYYSDSFFVDSKAESTITRTILLKKKNSFTSVLVDQKHQPLKDHYIMFSKSEYPNELTQFLKEYEKNGKIPETKNKLIYQTNENGESEGEAISTGKYFAIIFGPKIKGCIHKEILIASKNEKINIQIDVSDAIIKINFFENGKLYEGNLEGIYSDNFTTNSFNTKSGMISFSKLQPGKLHVHLDSNIFVNTTIKLIVPETGIIEQNIELKPGATLSGVLTTNNKPILGKNLSIYLYEKGNSNYDHNTQTDLNGRFQFKGLNPEITYIFHIDLPNYKIDPDAPREFRTGANDTFINVIEKYDFTGFIFDENERPVSIFAFSKSIIRNDTVVYDSYPHCENNKFTVGLEFGDKISFCIVAKGFASHYQTIVFEQSYLSTPMKINLKKGMLVKGNAFDLSGKPIFSGIIIQASVFHFNHMYSNKIDTYRNEHAALGEGGTFQIENAQVGEKFYLLSKDNSPIPFTIEEKNRSELIELKATRSFSFSGNLRSQKNVLQEGRRVMGERIESNEHVETYVDAKGNFYLNCLRPGKWVFTSNFRDMYKVVPRIEIEITDKDETYDWVVFR